MRNFVKATLLLATLFGAARASQAQVAIGIVIGAPPPTRVVVSVPPTPGAGFMWIEGYWYPAEKHYKWHEGYWTRPPYEGARWVAPHHDGERYYAGYWEGNRGRIEHDHHWDRDRDRDFHDHDHGRHRDHDHGRDDRQ